MNNIRAIEQKERAKKAAKKLLNVTRRINKGSFKDIPLRDIATYRRTLGVIDGILDNGVLVSGEDWVNNLSDLPTASKHVHKIIYVLNFGVGGSPWMSNGTIWVPATGKLTIANYYNPVNLGGTVTTEQILRQFTVPKATPVGGSIMRIGDIIRVTSDARKTGNVNTFTRAIRAGILGTISDGAFDSPSAAAASFNSAVERHYYIRTSDKVITKIGFPGSASINGVGSGALAGAVTFASSIDAADFFFEYTAKMDGGTDTYTQRTFIAELFSIGASS